MRKRFVMLLAGLSVTAFAVSLEKQEKAWIVKGDNYTALFEKADGYRPRFTSVGQRNVNWATVTPKILITGEREKFANAYCARDAAVNRNSLQVTPKVLSESPEKIELEFSYGFNGGTAVERVTLDNSPLIRYDVSVKNSGVRLSRFSLSGFLILGDAGGFFYPDGKRVQGFWMENGSMTDGPCWKYAWFEKSKVGMGVIALPGKDLAGVEYAMQNRKEGWQSDCAGMHIAWTPLQHHGMNASFDFSGIIIVGADPEKARAYAEKYLGKPEKPYFFAYETEKLTLRPGNDNKILADLRNPADKAVTVKAKTFITYGLDTEKQIAEETYSLNAGEHRRITIPVKFPADAKLGITIRTDLFDAAGKMIDRKFDICSVTDFVPRDSGFGIINAAQCYQDGSQEAWNAGFKKNYVGAYEYYLWAPSMIFGLAPKEDSWLPHTEGPYNNLMTKKFLKGLIDNAHSKGVGVYATLTGLWNHKVAFRHPDMLQYTENGQPCIYNGGFRPNGERRSVVKPNIYTKERSARWGDEFADSIDMFGWDGCRWDFTFLPSSSNDPLYSAQGARDWYDWKGRPRSELYPDSDATGTECLNAWRKAVEKRHPEAVHGANYQCNPVLMERYPNYFKAVASRSLILFEELLAYYKEQWNTYGKWGKELAIRDNMVRRVKGSTVVGSMTGLPWNSNAYHLANYTCASAGVKWWAYCGQSLAERSAERNRYLMRFSEYYFGHDFLLSENCPAEQISGEKVLFEPFVRERKTDGGREIAIPVVNVNPDNYICEYREVKPRKDVSFRIALKAGEKAEAWIMTPQNPEKAMKVPADGGTVVIPELKDACLVLIRCKGGR